MSAENVDNTIDDDNVVDDELQHHRSGLNNIFNIHRKHFFPSPLNIMDRLQNGMNEVQHRIQVQQESNISYKI